MKITPSFTHPQAILGVYDFLLSDKHNQRNINKYLTFIMAVSKLKKVLPSTSIHHKRVLHTAPGG